jgi:hypothetical protein
LLLHKALLCKLSNRQAQVRRPCARRRQTCASVGTLSRLNIPEEDLVQLAITFGYINKKPELHKRLKDKFVY